MSGIPEIFNPNEFTEKELVKLIYRDLMKLRQDFDDFIKNDTVQKELADLRTRVITLETDLKVEKQIRLEAQKANRRIVGWVSLAVTVISTAINFVFKYFR